MFPNRSFRVTVTLNGWFTTALSGTLRLRLEAASGVIRTLRLPATEAVPLSVALMVWTPAVSSVAEKVPWPFVSVESAGSMPGEGSLVVKCTVPA